MLARTSVFSWKNSISLCPASVNYIFQAKFASYSRCFLTFYFCIPVPYNEKDIFFEWFYEDLQDLLELTPKKDVLLIIGDWKAKVESQETPGVTGKFGLGIRNEAGQRLIVLPRKCTGHSKHPLPATKEKTLHMDITRWSTLKSD